MMPKPSYKFKQFIAQILSHRFAPPTGAQDGGSAAGLGPKSPDNRMGRMDHIQVAPGLVPNELGLYFYR